MSAAAPGSGLQSVKLQQVMLTALCRSKKSLFLVNAEFSMLIFGVFMSILSVKENDAGRFEFVIAIAVAGSWFLVAGLKQ